MKKLFFAAAAALLLAGAVSCSNSDSDKGNAGMDEFFPAAASDSLMSTFGDLVGASLQQNLANAMMVDSTITKEAFLKGLMYAFGGDTAQAYQYGMNIGLQMQGEFAHFESMGIKVDRNLWLKHFKEKFMADSAASQIEMSMMQGVFQQWNDSLRTAKRAYDLKVLAESPESKANLEKAENFLKEVMAKDPVVRKADNGIAVKIENPGEGKIAETDKVTLKVAVKALAGETPRSIPSTPIYVRSLPKGLQPAVQMLGKGGKGTFYIPGAQMFELDQAVRLGLAPNDLYTYEIEVLDINAPEVNELPAALPFK